MIGVGVGQAYHSAGSNGFDGLVRITPDGKLHVHTGVGNLGTYSYAATARVAAEVLGCAWENCVIERGDSRTHLPWNLGQFGSNTVFTDVAHQLCRRRWTPRSKLLEIAAKDLGGAAGGLRPRQREGVPQVRSVEVDSPSPQAAQRAIELGGKFSGKEAPEDI